jgi:hypothetical protein
MIRDQFENFFGIAEQLTPLIRGDVDSANDVYVGFVVLPGGETRERAYVKIFPPADRHQLVFNEVIAHHVAIQCSLPSPLTFPCACRVSLLKSSTRAVMAPDSNSEFVLGVASIDGHPKSLMQKISYSAYKWADLMNWPHIAQVAVFDELMGNDDRHIDNLIRCGNHDYVLIDHERIIFGEPWFNLDLELMRTKRCDANALADTIAEGGDQVMKQRMISLAQRYVRQNILYVPEISSGIERLCRAPNGTTDKLFQLLNDRRTLLPSLMAWHTQKGDLFRASTFR